MENQTQTPTPAKKPKLWLIRGAIALALLAVVIFIALRFVNREEAKPEVITVSTLQKIIQVSELSTFTAVYNGIAEVANEKDPEEVDYYVSYEARVKAGIDFEQIAISLDPETKKITVALPEIHITGSTVDVTSLDFIFFNKKANTSAVTQEALKACEEDVKRESEQQTAIYDLAKQNAVNVLKALISPIIEQLDDEYTLVID